MNIWQATLGALVRQGMSQKPVARPMQQLVDTKPAEDPHKNSSVTMTIKGPLAQQAASSPYMMETDLSKILAGLPNDAGKKLSSTADELANAQAGAVHAPSPWQIEQQKAAAEAERHKGLVAYFGSYPFPEAVAPVLPDRPEWHEPPAMAEPGANLPANIGAALMSILAPEAAGSVQGAMLASRAREQEALRVAHSMQVDAEKRAYDSAMASYADAVSRAQNTALLANQNRMGAWKAGMDLEADRPAASIYTPDLVAKLSAADASQAKIDDATARLGAAKTRYDVEKAAVREASDIAEKNTAANVRTLTAMMQADTAAANRQANSDNAAKRLEFLTKKMENDNRQRAIDWVKRMEISNNRNATSIRTTAMRLAKTPVPGGKKGSGPKYDLPEKIALQTAIELERRGQANYNALMKNLKKQLEDGDPQAQAALIAERQNYDTTVEDVRAKSAAYQKALQAMRVTAPASPNPAPGGRKPTGNPAQRGPAYGTASNRPGGQRVDPDAMKVLRGLK